MPRLKRYARRIKKVEDREDFIQHSLERILKEGEIRDLFWYATDIARISTDRKITRNRYIRKLDEKLEGATIRVNENVPLPCVGYKFHKEPDQESQIEATLFADKFIKSKAQLNSLYKGMISLHNLHGYSYKQLGQIFGFTESRVCQIYKEAQKHFKYKYAHSEV